jgi:hypothetical protein
MNDAYDWLRQYQEMIRRITEGPLADYQMLANSSSLLAIDRLEQLSVIPALAPAILSSTSEVFRQMSASVAVDEMASQAIAGDLAVVNANRTLVLHDSALTARSIVQMASTINLASVALVGVDWDEIGKTFQIGEDTQKRLQFLTNQLTFSHAALIEQARLSEGGFSAFPEFVVRVPGENLFVHSRAIRVLSPHAGYGRDDEEQAIAGEKRIDDDTDAIIEALLPRLSPHFVEMLRGADDPWLRKAPDWRRHSASSLRELLESVFHKVAPSDAVKKIVSDPGTELDEKGFPHLTVKVRWLCLYIGLPEYRQNVETDLLSALDVLKLTQSTVHSHSGRKFEEQFPTVRRRARVALRHLLLLWAARSS